MLRNADATPIRQTSADEPQTTATSTELITREHHAMSFKVPWIDVEPPSPMLYPEEPPRTLHQYNGQVRFEATAKEQMNVKDRDEKDKDSSSTLSGPPVFGRRLASAVRNIHKRRDGLVGKRVNIGNQRTRNETQRRAVNASTQQIVDAAEDFMSKCNLDQFSTPEFHTLHAAVQRSKKLNEILEDMESILQQNTKDLNLKESELYRKEKRVYKKLAESVGFTPQPPDLWASKPAPARSTNSTSTTKTHPQARRYYDAAGKVKLMRDRIHNMQVQQRQDLASRQAQKAAGRAMRVSDRHFHERFYAKLASLLRELEVAKQDAFLLKAACQRKKIPLEDDLESQEDQDIADLTFVEDRRYLANLASQRRGQNESLFLGSVVSEYMDSTTKINRWLKAMPQDGQGMDPTLPPDVQVYEDDGIEAIDDEEVAISSNPAIAPERTDVAVPIELRVTPEFLAEEGRRVSSHQGDVTLVYEAIASDFSGQQRTSSDREFSPSEFAGDAPTRRYSDPSPSHPILLRSDSFEVVSYFRRKQRSHSSRHNSR